MSCSSDPTTNSETMNPDFYKNFDQPEQVLQVLPVNMLLFFCHQKQSGCLKIL
jgi:hypothetical protein